VALILRVTDIGLGSSYIHDAKLITGRPLAGAPAQGDSDAGWSAAVGRSDFNKTCGWIEEVGGDGFIGGHGHGEGSAATGGVAAPIRKYVFEAFIGIGAQLNGRAGDIFATGAVRGRIHIYVASRRGTGRGGERVAGVKGIEQAGDIVGELASEQNFAVGLQEDRYDEFTRFAAGKIAAGHESSIPGAIVVQTEEVRGADVVIGGEVPPDQDAPVVRLGQDRLQIWGRAFDAIPRGESSIQRAVAGVQAGDPTAGGSIVGGEIAGDEDPIFCRGHGLEGDGIDRFAGRTDADGIETRIQGAIAVEASDAGTGRRTDVRESPTDQDLVIGLRRQGIDGSIGAGGEAGVDRAGGPVQAGNIIMGGAVQRVEITGDDDLPIALDRNGIDRRSAAGGRHEGGRDKGIIDQPVAGQAGKVGAGAGSVVVIELPANENPIVRLNFQGHDLGCA